MTATTVNILGVDGSSWNLTTGEQGARLGPNLSGLESGTWTQQASQSARQAGRTWKGTTYDPRTVSLRVHVGDTDNRDEPRRGDAWRHLDSAFRAALSPEVQFWLVVISSSGYRWWGVRLEDFAPADVKRDPSLLGSQMYNMTLVADDPWARGFPVTATPAASAATSLLNAGDVTTWPVWRVTGPTSGSATVTVGSGSNTTTLPPVSSGQVLVFDTDPAKRTILTAFGVSRRGELTAQDKRAPIPAGTSVPFTWTYTGTLPSVTVSVPQRYRAAW